ncbi:N-acetylmuramoyl-L-alanine amidase [Bacillus sp. Cr_A10]|uniref:N-acetylmuramoyl-L-alanine amidase family protein n=1 Tax=Bacillus sp. Cr_A10 TaxID=3033993 RepID=UPI0023DC9D84|nr:N-acetylmuramoyl-L-alanine amidase [Bacillus sp. Cr_A10]MDF2068015.1 N-acetylmuramoyl-L-alanine amidase [Bacillus sp. Cr_A10]
MALDAGHGYNTPGKRTPDDEKEWSFNDVVVRYVIAGLKFYVGVEILRLDDPTGKTDTPLGTRTNQANNWKADVLISFHKNASKGEWGNHTGTETYIYPKTSKSRTLAEAIHPQIVKKLKLKNRGIRESDFHMLRESNMPAILIESGYMDSRIDIVALRDESRLRAIADGTVFGLVNYFGLIKKEVAGVSNTIQLTSGQQKAKDTLVKHGLMAANYEIKDSVDVRFITMLAPLLNKLEEKAHFNNCPAH